MTNPLYDLMHKGESGAAGYNAYNRGTATNAQGQSYIVPGRPPMDFSTLTLGQVSDLQHLNRRDPDRVFAIGKYQIIPDTMDGAIRSMGLDRNQPFSPQLQDRIFSEYLIVEKRPDIHAYITGKPGATLHAAQYALACEWASFSDPNKGDMRSRYGSGNHASISLRESADALNAMRAEYAKNIAEGRSPQEAWRATIGNTAQPSRTQPEQSQQPTPRPAANALADCVLRQSERGADVQGLQASLNRLQMTDAAGQPLREDGNFGQRTREAVERFQRENGLKVDGIAGPRTLEAIGQRLPPRTVTVERAEVTGLAGGRNSQTQTPQPQAQTPLITDAAHPNNALYAAIARQLPPGTRPEAIANVTLQVMENGMTDPSKLGRVGVNNNDAFVMPAGSFGGNWVRVDLTAPTASLKAMSEHMAGETREAQQQQQQRQNTQTIQNPEQNRPGPVMV